MDDSRGGDYRIMYLLLKLFATFFKIGGASFGGGYAMLPFIEKEVIEINGWLTAQEFLDVLAISQITPGPVAINAATFIGYRFYGISGSLIATAGIVAAPFIYMSLMSRFLNKYKSSEVFTRIFYYLRPVTTALILSAAYSTVSKSIIDIRSFVIFAVSFAMILFTKIHPIAIILGFGVMGIFLF